MVASLWGKPRPYFQTVRMRLKTMADVKCWQARRVQGSGVSGRSNGCEFVFETSWIREGDTLPAWCTGPLARDNVLDRFVCCRGGSEKTGQRGTYLSATHGFGRRTQLGRSGLPHTTSTWTVIRPLSQSSMASVACFRFRTESHS
jgi:hypothetical protein